MTQLSVGGKPTQVRIACALYPTSILLVKPRPGLFGNTKTLFSTLYFHVLRIKHIFSVNICQSDKNYRSLSEHGLAVLPVISVVTHGTPCRAGFHCSQLPREISGCTWHVDDTGVTAQKPVVVLMSVPTCAASEPARRRLPQPRPELWPWDQRLSDSPAAASDGEMLAQPVGAHSSSIPSWCSFPSAEWEARDGKWNNWFWSKWN